MQENMSVFLLDTLLKQLSKCRSILAKQGEFQRLAAVNGIRQVRTIKDSNKISICTHSNNIIVIDLR